MCYPGNISRIYNIISMRKCGLNSTNHLQMDCWKFPDMINTSPRQHCYLVFAGAFYCPLKFLPWVIIRLTEPWASKSRRMIILAETLMKLVKICQCVWIFRSYLQEIRKMPTRCFRICDRNMAELENDNHMLLSRRGHKRPISVRVLDRNAL